MKIAIVKTVLIILVAGLSCWIARSSIYAVDLPHDEFDDPTLSQWQILGSGAMTEFDSDPGSTHGNVLKITNPGDNSHLVIKRTIDPSVAAIRNLIYEIEFWDDPQRNYGAGFYVLDANQRYIEFVVDGNSTNYILRNGSTSFDTKIPRSNGWHKIQIFVTEVGSYLAIDGQSLVYLRAQIPYPNENSTSFAINNDLQNITEVVIEYPSWSKPASIGYWDNFKVSEFRTQNKTTSQKEEDMILEYLASYETNLTSPDFITATNQMKGIPNFQLARLSLAGAYGVRYKTSGNTGDLNKFKEYLSSVVDDYWSSWKNQDYETPIPGQALAVLASWQWQNLDQGLKDNIKSVLDNLGTVANQKCISSWINEYNPDNTVSDSKAEEFAWFASYLKFVADIYHDPSTPACGSNDPNTTKWSFRAANFACAATTHADPTDPKKVDGSDNCQNVNPPNPALTNNFIMRNHQLNHPGYALTIAWGMAQAQLYQLNQGKSGDQIDLDYRRNITALYNNNIANLVRFNNYTYKALDPSKDLIFAYTGKDDWDQDATLQDPAWAYFDKIFTSRPAMNWTNKLDPIVNYAWLTRAGKSAYPALVDNELSSVVPQGNSPCGTGSCLTYKMNSSLYFFLNSMDAIDRFETLFIINPDEYKLNLLANPATPTPPLLPGDLNHDNKVNIRDYSQLVTDFGKTGSPGFVVADINNDGRVDVFDYNILVGNFGK